MDPLLRLLNCVALRIPTKGQPVGTYNGNVGESHTVKGLRSKLSPKESRGVGFYPPQRNMGLHEGSTETTFL